MITTKRKLSIVLAVIMITSLLSGCSNNSDNSRDNDPGYTIGVDFTPPEFVYLSEVVLFPMLSDGMTDIRKAVLTGDAVYFIARGRGDENAWFDTYGLFSMDVDGNNPIELLIYPDETFATDNISGFVTIDALHVGSSGYIWIVESRGSFDLDRSDISVFLRKLDKTGTELSAFNISDIAAGEDWFHVSALNIDDTGNIYVASGADIYILNDQGRLLLEFLPFDLAMYGGELVFKGYPTENRDGNIFIASTSLAIAASCTDKDAAWEFIRIFLTEDHQRDNTPWSIPVNRVVLEERLEETMKSPGFSIGDGDDMIDIKGFSQKEIDTLRDLINNTTRMRSDDETLWLLISETAADFFNGLITAQDAARIIQSRVTIYLAEQH